MSAEVIQDDPEVVVVKVVVKKQKTSLSGTPVTPVHQVVDVDDDVTIVENDTTVSQFRGGRTKAQKRSRTAVPLSAVRPVPTHTGNVWGRFGFSTSAVDTAYSQISSLLGRNPRKESVPSASEQPPAEEEVSSLSDKQCPICLDAFKNITSTPCGHCFCYECIKASLDRKKECPSCRKKMDVRSLRRLFL